MKTIPIDSDRLAHAYHSALSALLAERNAEGFWIGELSASALATATAVSALAAVQKQHRAHGRYEALITGGLVWLVDHQNADGGWGDTGKSQSNISTTMLVRAAFHLAGSADRYPGCLRRAESWLQDRHGKSGTEQVEALRARYGKDRTFAVPILTTCALAGLVPWDEVPHLPFELACFPQGCFRYLQMPVVSYALPALIAIGQAVHHHRPPRNPLIRLGRRLAIRKSLRVLQAIQPSSGGFLEAVPLTSFVTLSLASIGLDAHPVTERGVGFIETAVRPDGSWPIDSNLSVWVTTLAVNALASAGALGQLENLPELRNWLGAQQFRQRHPYTGAQPGGWGWTHLPGSVPDADDTAGALLALAHLESVLLAPLVPVLGEEGSGVRGKSYAKSQPPHPNPSPPSTGERGGHHQSSDTTAPSLPSTGERGGHRQSSGPTVPSPPRTEKWGFRNRLLGTAGDQIPAGLSWLAALQNRDGGLPTFCRGWGYLPFDRSGADLTAHGLRAMAVWLRRWDQVSPGLSRGLLCRVIGRGLNYLEGVQRPEGSWLPLWFGNQHAPDDENCTYGTARVLAAYRDLHRMNTEPARRGLAWLLSVENADGGWGGASGAPSSVEETALVTEVLLDAGPEFEAPASRGLAWLVEQVEAGNLKNAVPIGFYFAKLWYFEKLYPLIFTVAALGRAQTSLPNRRRLAARELTH